MSRSRGLRKATWRAVTARPACLLEVVLGFKALCWIERGVQRGFAHRRYGFFCSIAMTGI